MLLCDRGADLSGGHPDYGGRFSCERVLAVRPTRWHSLTHSESIGCTRADEEHGIDRRDGVLELGRNRRVVRIVVVAVERQILERTLRHFGVPAELTRAFASNRL